MGLSGMAWMISSSPSVVMSTMTSRRMADRSGPMMSHRSGSWPRSSTTREWSIAWRMSRSAMPWRRADGWISTHHYRTTKVCDAVERRIVTVRAPKSSRDPWPCSAVLVTIEPPDLLARRPSRCGDYRALHRGRDATRVLAARAGYGVGVIECLPTGTLWRGFGGRLAARYGAVNAEQIAGSACCSRARLACSVLARMNVLDP